MKKYKVLGVTDDDALSSKGVDISGCIVAEPTDEEFEKVGPTLAGKLSRLNPHDNVYTGWVKVIEGEERLASATPMPTDVRGGCAIFREVMLEELEDEESNMSTEWDEICGRCGLTKGAHRACDPHNQCPEHEGYMDWPDTHRTIFEPTGIHAKVPYGTLSKVFGGE